MVLLQGALLFLKVTSRFRSIASRFTISNSYGSAAHSIEILNPFKYLVLLNFFPSRVMSRYRTDP
jgi:hypothetical protein